MARDVLPNLEAAINQAGGPVAYLRASKDDRLDLEGEHNPPRIVPEVPNEFSQWERETHAWRNSVALFDQSHHMEGVFISGPDAQRFLTTLAANNLERSNRDSAHQIICCGSDGRLIGDAIVFHLEENLFSVYGAGFVTNWLRFNAEVTDLRVEATRDNRTPTYANGFPVTRRDCRYQIQGPRAGELIEKLNGRPLGNVKFFQMTEITVGGQRCRAIRHGMAGAIGLELWGPWEHRSSIRDAIIEAGQEFDLRLVGSMAYLVTAVESGWYQAVLPAIYSSNETRPYREWLPSTGLEAATRLTGSMVHEQVEGYYRTPFDLGYGRFVDFEHDFLGREALQLRAKERAYKKVTLQWLPEDVVKIVTQMLTPNGAKPRYLHWPSSSEQINVHYDRLTSSTGSEIGNSAYTAYSANDCAMLSLALVKDDVEFGDEVIIHWGEAGGGWGSRQFSATAITPIRAIVSPTPYARVAREDYRR